jgi:hypothetical protein
MAGFMPAIHVLLAAGSDVDGRDKPGHDGVWGVDRLNGNDRRCSSGGSDSPALPLWESTRIS